MRAYLIGRTGELKPAVLLVTGRPPFVQFRVFEVGRFGESEPATVTYRFDHEISDVGLVYVETADAVVRDLA